MKRLVYAVGVLAVLGFGVLHPVLAQNSLTVREIMGKANKGDAALLMVIGKQLKADSPPWGEIQKESKELVSLGTAMSKNTPRKGDKASWDEQTKQYVVNAQALEAAADKQDKAA